MNASIKLERKDGVGGRVVEITISPKRPKRDSIRVRMDIEEFRAFVAGDNQPCQLILPEGQ